MSATGIEEQPVAIGFRFGMLKRLKNKKAGVTVTAEMIAAMTAEMIAEMIAETTTKTAAKVTVETVANMNDEMAVGIIASTAATVGMETVEMEIAATTAVTVARIVGIAAILVVIAVTTVETAVTVAVVAVMTGIGIAGMTEADQIAVRVATSNPPVGSTRWMLLWALPTWSRPSRCSVQS